jgi:hypothetical protein
MGDYALFRIKTEFPESHVTTGELSVTEKSIF